MADKEQLREIILSGEAARRLGISQQRLAELADEGKVPSVGKTQEGFRLFDPNDIEKARREREHRGR